MSYLQTLKTLCNNFLLQTSLHPLLFFISSHISFISNYKNIFKRKSWVELYCTIGSMLLLFQWVTYFLLCVFSKCKLHQCMLSLQMCQPTVARLFSAKNHYHFNTFYLFLRSLKDKKCKRDRFYLATNVQAVSM